MKTKSIFVLLLVLSVILTSCCKQNNYVTPSGEVSTQKKSVTGFTKLDVSSIFNVYVTFSDSEESVIVEANDNLHQYIQISKSGENLVVKLANNINIRDGETTLKVFITMKQLTKISGSGLVNFQFENEMTGQNLMIDLSGASKLKGTLKLEKLNVSLSGSSLLELSGESDLFELDASGASIVRDYSFVINKFQADLDGASELHLTINESMNITASGASIIYYKGNGQINTQILSGASQIIKMD